MSQGNLYQVEILKALNHCLVSSVIVIVIVTATSFNYGNCTHIYSVSTLKLKLLYCCFFLSKTGLVMYEFVTGNMKKCPLSSVHNKIVRSNNNKNNNNNYMRQDFHTHSYYIKNS